MYLFVAFPVIGTGTDSTFAMELVSGSVGLFQRPAVIIFYRPSIGVRNWRSAESRGESVVAVLRDGVRSLSCWSSAKSQHAFTNLHSLSHVLDKRISFTLHHVKRDLPIMNHGFTSSDSYSFPTSIVRTCTHHESTPSSLARRSASQTASTIVGAGIFVTM